MNRKLVAFLLLVVIAVLGAGVYFAVSTQSKPGVQAEAVLLSAIVDTRSRREVRSFARRNGDSAAPPRR